MELLPSIPDLAFATNKISRITILILFGDFVAEIVVKKPIYIFFHVSYTFLYF